MRKFVFTIFLPLCPIFLKADGFVLFQYEVEITLRNNAKIKAYLIVADYPPIKSFKTSEELKSYVLETSKDEHGKRTRLYSKFFTILNFEGIPDDLRGTVLYERSERVDIPDEDFVFVRLMSAQSIKTNTVHNVSDNEVAFLTTKPNEIVGLELEEAVNIIGDAYIYYDLLSYNPVEKLAPIKKEIEAEYFKMSANCNEMEKSIIWRKIYLERKKELFKKKILLIEGSEY